MEKFSKKLQSAYRNAYYMKPWKNLAIYPKIIQEKKLSEFTPAEKKKLTRKGFRWYVRFNYLNPETNKFERVPPFTSGVNREFKDFDQRYEAIHRLHQSAKQLLEDGYSPFDVAIQDDEILTMDKALDHALDNKKLKVSKDTFDNYEIRVDQLKRFLKKKGVLHRDTFSFNFKIIREFLKEVAQTSSMSNRNNALRTIKAIFSDMYENDMIKENYVAKIKIEKVPKNRFKAYSHKQAIDILDHLEKEDPIMALFIKFIGYNFLRPKEVVRLKVKDLDLENKLLTVFVKQGKNKTKRIPDEIIAELLKYDLSKKDNFLFARNKISGKWNREEVGRRQYYSKRYTQIKKALGYGEGYVMYSFRHTYITIGYQNLRKRLSKDAAIDELMRYTGHDSREALKGYIHYHEADIVGEYKGEVK